VEMETDVELGRERSQREDYRTASSGDESTQGKVMSAGGSGHLVRLARWRPQGNIIGPTQGRRISEPTGSEEPLVTAAMRRVEIPLPWRGSVG
jgi:hypothetical protein